MTNEPSDREVSREQPEADNDRKLSLGLVAGIFLYLVVIRLGGLAAGLLCVWAAATRGISEVPGWLLSAGVVLVSLFLSVAGLFLPNLISTFIRYARPGLLASAVLCGLTDQWVPGATMLVAAGLTVPLIAGLAGLSEEPEHPHSDLDRLDGG